MLQEVELVHVPTSEWLVDIFTKALGKEQVRKDETQTSSSG
jgi:hypothetical protein